MKKIRWYLISAVLAGVVFGLVNRASQSPSINSVGNGGGSAGNGGTALSTITALPNDTLSLVTEPDDGMASLLAMIRSASTSIDLAMYEMDDPHIETALVAAEKRGVAVRVLLNGGYYGTPDTGANAANVINQAAYAFLNANGVEAKWTPAYFALTHQKSLVVDGNAAMIMTFNLLPQFYKSGRDFGIVDRDPRDVSAIENVFNKDWDGNQSAAANNSDDSESGTSDLVWSPGSENAILSIINGAKTSLDIYNEEMADDDITATLIAAAKRGVVVRIDMTNSSEWNSAFEKLSEAGASIRTYAANAPLYIHAKMIVADGATANATAFIGSENFSYSSLADNRELGIVFNNPSIIQSLEKTFSTDWKTATPFDD